MPKRRLSQAQYRQLADFRHTLRRFLRFSESAAQHAGLSAQQYHALLALRAVASARQATIAYVAKSLIIEHNTAVELVKRLAGHGLVHRRQSGEDRRKVEVRISAKGERMLDRLVHVHRRELARLAGRLLPVLRLVDEDA